MTLQEFRDSVRREKPPVFRLDPATGRQQLWKEFKPADPAGISRVLPPLITRDGKAYAYSYGRVLSDLYLVEGLK